MTLNDALKRENNNFDLLRLVAACMVIVGHAHALVPVDASRDLILTLLGFDYSGSLAVKFFFFLSGLVVTNSLIEKPHVAAFAVARIFRLMPALIACVVLSALVLGPMVTSLTLPNYFSDLRTWSYIAANIFLVPQWGLPEVFAGHRQSAVNGSLWTLPFEVVCYVVLAGLGLLRILQFRFIASATMTAIVAYAIFTYAVTVYDIAVPIHLPLAIFRGLEPRLLPACFAFGALLALHKHVIHLRFRIMAGLILLCAISHGSGLFQFVLYASLFYGSILVATTPLMTRVRIPGDFSYGVYVYGFPLQQLLVFLKPNWGVHENQVSALLGAMLAGCCSWYLIERPSIRLGRRLSDRAARSIFPTRDRRPGSPLSSAPPPGSGTVAD